MSDLLLSVWIRRSRVGDLHTACQFLLELANANEQVGEEDVPLPMLLTAQLQASVGREMEFCPRR